GRKRRGRPEDWSSVSLAHVPFLSSFLVSAFGVSLSLALPVVVPPQPTTVLIRNAATRRNATIFFTGQPPFPLGAGPEIPHHPPPGDPFRETARMNPVVNSERSKERPGVLRILLGRVLLGRVLLGLVLLGLVLLGLVLLGLVLLGLVLLGLV